MTSQTRYVTLLAIVSLLIMSCKDNSIVTNSVYCWNIRSRYDAFTNEEAKAIFDNNIKKIYYKLCDVTWNKYYHAEPISLNELPLEHTVAAYAEIVPCMFFTNEVMIKSSKDELEYMAKKIASKINKLKVKEFQIDCDWSVQSKENYFLFSKSLRSELNKKITLSATIRLYQYKYPGKAGVPPVDRGMLMLYNFNPPGSYNGKNAIFEKDEAEKYLDNSNYKLPLDFAIAHFTWRVLYDIDNSFIGFVNKADAEDIMKYADSTKANSLYVLKSDASIEGGFARSGQKLAIYEMGQSSLQQSYGLINKLKNSKSYAVAIFELNEASLKYLLSNESIFKKANN